MKRLLSEATFIMRFDISKLHGRTRGHKLQNLKISPFGRNDMSELCHFEHNEESKRFLPLVEMTHWGKYGGPHYSVISSATPVISSAARNLSTPGSNPSNQDWCSARGYSFSLAAIF